MFKYDNNEQVKIEFKKTVVSEKRTMTSVANNYGMIPQQLNNKFNNERIGLNELSSWLDALGYDLYIDFVKRDNQE